jgi:NDP-sugar pyrophosphorylase family protein
MISKSDLSPEFAILILAARPGARMHPLALPSYPKHILPVSGVSLLARQLHVLLECGFSNCIVAIADDDTRTTSLLQELDQIKKNSSSCFTLKDHLSIEIFQLPDDCSGSMQALRCLEMNSMFSPSSHIIVIPGDLVLTDTEVLEKLANAHRNGNLQDDDKVGCTMLFSHVGEEDEHGIPLKESAKAKKNGFSRDEDQIEFTALAMDINLAPRVIWKQSKIDVEDDEDMIGKSPKLVLPKPRLRCGSFTTVRTDYLDVHAYVLSPWIRNLCMARKSMVSIKDDLIPLLIEYQFQDIESAFGEEEEAKLLFQHAFFSAITGEDTMESSLQQTPTFSVRAVVVEGAKAMRACTVPAYLIACRETMLMGHNNLNDANYNHKFNSLIMKGAEIGEKSQIRSSVVGHGVRLGAKCKLNNVVIMDNAIIGENVILQNAVIGEACVVGENCSLSYVRVAHGKAISPGTKEKGELSMDEI